MHGVKIEIARGGRIRVAGKAVAMSRGRHTLADIGDLTDQAELRITGRAAPIANIGGRKVSPAEVEAALLSIPGVTAAWVKVRRHASRDELAAVVETSQPESKIVSDLADRLAKWKLPRRLVVAKDLPRNARGKLDAAAMQALVDS
jgi:acyl-coenzyme A synthetase/AMP-(fatty) acid ligase